MTDVQVQSPTHRVDDGDPQSTHDASDRIIRSLAATLGVGASIYGVAVLPQILHESHYYRSWWTPFAMVAIFGSGLALAAISFRTSLVVVRRFAGAVAVGFLLVGALAPVALTATVDGAQSTWQFRVAAVGAIAASLAFRPLQAAGYVVAAAATATFANYYALGETGIVALGQDFGRCFATAGLFTWVVVCAVRGAAILDRATADAEHEAAKVAAANATELERERFAGLIHDAVLSTLLDASRFRNSGTLARQAATTLRQLDELRPADIAAEFLDATTTIERIHAVATQIIADISVAGERSPDAGEFRMPASAAAAVESALAEAVRNSLRHSAVEGRAVRRNISVTVSATALHVELVDDGAGFDPADVPVDRLGVKGSIIGRMNRTAGGGAELDSRPGHGTRVTLTWSAQA